MDSKKEQRTENRKRQPANRIPQIGSVEKSTVIVLVIAAAFFVGMFFYAQSFNVLGSIGDGTGVPEDGMQFERGTVKEILSDNKEVEENTEGAYRGTQKLSVVVRSGSHKGETLVVYNYFGPNTGVPVEVGDSVVITIKDMPNREISATVYEFNRIPILVIFLLLFFLAIVAVGGRTGIRSLIGLVFTVICLFFILIPLLQRGAPMVPATFAMCAYIALVSFTILGGVHRKTISAFLGTVAGAFLAMIFGLGVQYLAKIDGLRIDDAEPLLQLRYMGFPIHLRGLLVAGIIVSALGAVMDIAMSISSALEEVYAANPSATRKDLFRSGMNIGRDMVGTMTNTLILAFLGSEFTLIILLYSSGYTFYHLYSNAFVSLETISGISASIGMVLAVPLTALIASRLISGGRKT